MKHEQLYWNDINIGDEIPGFSLELDETRVCLQVSGSQDWYAVHHDKGFANNSGMPERFFNTGFLTAAIGRLLTSWIGLEGWIRALTVEMRRMNLAGQVMTVSGKVTNKYVDGNEHFVEADVWTSTGDQVNTPCKAKVVLPARSK